MTYILIAVGGALGSVCRVYFGSLIPNYVGGTDFPLPILMVNIIGCFVMGLVSELFGLYVPADFSLRLFLVSGFLGGFTTFSAFSLEFMLLWQKHMYQLAITYCILSFLLSIMAFGLGILITNILFK